MIHTVYSIVFYCFTVILFKKKKKMWKVFLTVSNVLSIHTGQGFHRALKSIKKINKWVVL